MTGTPAGRAARVVLTGIAALVLSLALTGTASAHDGVNATSPTAGASLPAPPAAVELQVTSPPQVLGTEVRVTGPDGSLVSAGDPEVLDSTVRQPLADDLAAGAYTVDWRVTSGDGHPITGSFGFTVAEGAAASSSPTALPAGPSADPSTEVAVGAASASAPASSSSSTALLVGGAVVVLAAAGLVAWRLRRRA